MEGAWLSPGRGGGMTWPQTSQAGGWGMAWLSLFTQGLGFWCWGALAELTAIAAPPPYLPTLWEPCGLDSEDPWAADWAPLAYYKILMSLLNCWELIQPNGAIMKYEFLTGLG